MKEERFWKYDSVSVTLHWVIAVILIVMISLGFYMVSIAGTPDSGKYFALHKSIGLIAALFILLRVIWRLGHEPGDLPFNVPRWQAKISRTIHFLLYVCMILMPLTGFLASSFGSHGVAFFGWQIPRWVNENKAISEQIFGAHIFISWMLTGLIVLHVLAAFKHLFINRDNVFQRMWF